MPEILHFTPFQQFFTSLLVYVFHTSLRVACISTPCTSLPNLCISHTFLHSLYLHLALETPWKATRNLQWTHEHVCAGIRTVSTLLFCTWIQEWVLAWGCNAGCPANWCIKLRRSLLQQSKFATLNFLIQPCEKEVAFFAENSTKGIIESDGKACATWKMISQKLFFFVNTPFQFCFSTRWSVIVPDMVSRTTT